MHPRHIKLKGYKRFATWVLGIVAMEICLCSGCMVGPEYERPRLPVDANDKFIYGEGFSQEVNEFFASENWWQRFGDAATTRLVEDALARNYDLIAAAARVMQSQALLAEVRGAQMPDIDYGLSRDRAKRSFKFGPERFSILATTWTQDISVSYMVDIFGGLRRQERSAWAQLLSSEQSRRTVLHGVIASAVSLRAEIATIQRRLAIARANTENWRENVEFVERRYEYGLVSPLDVRLVRENLAASEAVEALFEEQLIKARNGLDVLLGQRPGTGDRVPETLADLPNLEPVPIGIPAGLLDRRPDVRAAEFALRSASEDVGVSIAALYPSLTLTGAYGRSADVFDDLFIDTTEIYSAIVNISAPIWRGGQLRARVKFSEARYKELAADYAKTVLEAMREVEDALAAERLLQDRLSALERRLEEALAAERIAEDRYVKGVEQIITVLETERRRWVAENEVNETKGRLWTNRVNLILALGGDWVVKPEDKYVVKGKIQ